MPYRDKRSEREWRLRNRDHLRAYRQSKKRLCGCGCGERTAGAFKTGHRPVRAYRFVGHARLHRVRAERALGKALPPGAVVHHADGSKGDAAPLVICQDTAFHALLHVRMRVRAAGGDPNTQRICSSCRKLRALTDVYRSNVCKVCGRIAMIARKPIYVGLGGVA